MRLFSSALALALSAGAAYSDELIAPSQIIDAAVGDWNKDGEQDLAFLAILGESDMKVGLYIYLREPNEGLLQPVLAVQDKIWGERGFGRQPSITALANGSIAITEQNFGIGRERWQATRTVAYRGGKFVVAGFSFESYDSLQEDEPLSCDLNFLSGKGTVNDRAVTFKAGSPTLEAWTDEGGSNPGLSICRKE